MKTDFFLRKRRSNDTYIDTIILLFFWIILIIVTRSYHLLSFAILIYLICVVCYTKMDCKNSSLCINKENITYNNVFLRKKIDISSISCIRIHPEWIHVWGVDKILKDKTGNILFRMRFYHNYYEKDELDGYDFIEEIKRFFVERQICHCIYDKEALDYLLTLNPNIKVIYEKE